MRRGDRLAFASSTFGPYGAFSRTVLREPAISPLLREDASQCVVGISPAELTSRGGCGRLLPFALCR